MTRVRCFGSHLGLCLVAVSIAAMLAACSSSFTNRPQTNVTMHNNAQSAAAPVVEWVVEAGEPGAIAAGPGGEVYVTINNSHRIARYSPEGELLGDWTVEAGEPGAVAVGPGGEVYVTINNSHRVVRYSPTGEPLGEWTVEAGEPGNVAVSPQGVVYVTINNSHRVVGYR